MQAVLQTAHGAHHVRVVDGGEERRLVRHRRQPNLLDDFPRHALHGELLPADAHLEHLGESAGAEEVAHSDVPCGVDVEAAVGERERPAAGAGAALPGEGSELVAPFEEEAGVARAHAVDDEVRRPQRVVLRDEHHRPGVPQRGVLLAELAHGRAHEAAPHALRSGSTSTFVREQHVRSSTTTKRPQHSQR